MQYNEYKKPIIFAIALHVILLILLIIKFNFFPDDQPSSANQPIINAVIINAIDVPVPKTTSVAAQPIPKPVQPEQPIVPPIEKVIPPEKQQPIPKKVVEEKSVTERAVAIKDKQAQEKLAAKQKQEELQKRRETELQKQLAQELNQEKLDLTKAKQQAVKKQKALAEQRLQEQLAAEQKELSAAAAYTTKQQSEIDRYKSLIKQSVSRRWIIPDNTNSQLSCKLLIRLAPGGVVIDVKVIESSGNVALDRSARAAVFKASPLPVPTDTALFDEFRELNLTMRPEAILNA